MAHDVFISYAVEDRTVANAACAKLEAKSTRCWIAPRDVLPGMDYAEAIIEAVNQSRVVVLIFSARSNYSPHVRRELERAVNAGIPILPFRIEDVPLSPSLEYFIGTVHWLDALTPPLEKHVAHLAETVKLLLARMGKPEQLAAEAEALGSVPTSAEAVVDEGLRTTALERELVGLPPRPAGFAKAALRIRAAAFAVDTLVAAVATFWLMVLALQPGVMLVGKENGPQDIPGWLALFLTAPLYQWTSNSLGTSLGKRLFRLVVVRDLPWQNRIPSAEEARLGRPGWKLGLLRTLVSWVGLFALGLGYLWALWDEKGKTWHDTAAGTLVLRVE